jgi:uridine kinase
LKLDIDALREDLIRRNAKVVAIDGRGGAGKSTLARLLAESWPAAVVIEMDDFHDDRERLLKGVLEPLKADRPGRYQRYDWAEGRLAEWHDVSAAAIVLLEGVYASSELLRDCYDYAIWVECPYEVRLQRGVDRDGGGMRTTWVEHWMPAEDRYVDQERPDVRADLVLDGTGDPDAGVVYDIISSRSA